MADEDIGIQRNALLCANELFMQQLRSLMLHPNINERYYFL